MGCLTQFTGPALLKAVSAHCSSARVKQLCPSAAWVLLPPSRLGPPFKDALPCALENLVSANAAGLHPV